MEKPCGYLFSLKVAVFTGSEEEAYKEAVEELRRFIKEENPDLIVKPLFEEDL